MMARLRAWGHKRSKPLFILAITIVVIGVLVLIIFGYLLRLSWTGFFNRTLWDWLQLLIIPIAVVVVGYLLNRAQQHRQEKIAEDNRKTDLEIANTRQQETTLANYLAEMTDLLVGKHLRQSEPEAEVRDIALTQTLTVLRQLDGNRKGLVLRFLYEAGLLKKARDIIDLNTIDLRGTDLLQLLDEDHVLERSEVVIDMAEVLENQADLSDSQTALLQSLYETKRLIKGIKQGKIIINLPRILDDSPHSPHLYEKEFELLHSLYETGLMHRAKLIIDVTGTAGLGESV